MAKAAPKAGKGPCPNCGASIWFRTSAGGNLCYRCQDCDASGYAEPGGKAHTRWVQSFTERAGAADEPPPKPAADDPPKPQPRPASVFSLGAL